MPYSTYPYDSRSQTPLQQDSLKSIPNIQNLAKILYFNKIIYKNQKIKELLQNAFYNNSLFYPKQYFERYF